MLTSVLTNIYTILAISYQIYQFHKTRKETRKPNKQSPYVFILLCMYLSTEQMFAYILKYIPAVSFIKFMFVTIICLPWTHMASRIYKEYVERLLNHFEEPIDNFVHGIVDSQRERAVALFDNCLYVFKRRETRMLSLKEDEGIEILPIEESERGMKNE